MNRPTQREARQLRVLANAQARHRKRAARLAVDLERFAAQDRLLTRNVATVASVSLQVALDHAALCLGRVSSHQSADER